MRTFSTLLCVLMVGTAAAADKPNVLIVMTDDQGLGDFGFTGNPILKTPNFDRFASESVRFTDFHVSPMCSPTRGQLMTGLAALRNGATSVTAGRTFLRPGLATMPELFAANGYKTGLFGKWHLGDSYPHRPIDKGFQESAYHLGWGLRDSTQEFGTPLFDGRYFHNGSEKKSVGHCTDHWFDRATAWMGERRDRKEPFFCYLPTNAPHAPFVDKPEFAKPYEGKGPAAFFGMIAHLDQRFGQLERFLTESGLRENTIVVFMTDNGGTAGVKTFNAGLRGGKTTNYEGGHRVPCWVRRPAGNLGKARDIDVPTQNTDLLPTFAELCGFETKPKFDRQDTAWYAGISLAGLLTGATEKLEDRKFVVQYGQVPKKADACVIWKQWRLVNGVELYDVVADRSQTRNIAAEHPNVVAAMTDHYDGWWQSVSNTLDDFVPISLGAKQQPVVELTSADWENVYADNTGFVRTAVGGPNGSRWHVQVETAGRYEFVLRRWPEFSGKALGATYEGDDRAPAYNLKSPVKSFPGIDGIKVQIAGIQADGPAKASERSAKLELTLPKGKTTLKAWFTEGPADRCGAFFVTVCKLP